MAEAAVDPISLLYKMEYGVTAEDVDRLETTQRVQKSCQEKMESHKKESAVSPSKNV